MVSYEPEDAADRAGSEPRFLKREALRLRGDG